MRKIALAFMLWASLLLAACTGGSSTPFPALPTDDEILFGKATVEEIEVVFLESFPLQVHVQAKGYLADSCTTIDEVSIDRADHRFKVEITTRRPAQEMCAQIVQPFEKSIPLDVYGLPAGDYSVDVNGVQAEFTFAQDNILPEGG
jgi:inhibitor of cysteine peptidase